MDEFESLSHTKWECKYHVVFIPKCRRRTLYEQLRQQLVEVFKKLVAQKESRTEEGHLMPDQVHMTVAIPPKYAVSQVIGYIKGKSAIHLARVYGETKRSFVGQHFWARGYFVSTMGRDEEMIREYIRNQDEQGCPRAVRPTRRLHPSGFSSWSRRRSSGLLRFLSRYAAATPPPLGGPVERRVRR